MNNWRQTIEAFPDLGDFGSWPTIDPADLPEDKRQIFLKRRNAVRLVLEGYKVRTAAQTTGLSSACVSKTLNRCLAQRPGQENVALTRGLIPGVHVREPIVSLDDQNKSKAGYRGCFKGLLKTYPDIENAMRKAIQLSMVHRRDALNISAKGLHSIFLDNLRKKGFGANDYPFCTHDQAKESIRRWYIDVRAEIANAKLPTDKRDGSIAPMPGFPHPLQIVEMDHHTIDAESALHLQLEESAFQTSRRVPRFWLGLAVDRETTAIIGATYEFAAQPSQDSVLACLGQIESGLTSDLGLANLITLPEESVLPQDTDQDLAILPHVIKLDNAWAHYATHVRTIALNRWNSTLCYGVPAIPLARQVVESSFRKLESELHRLPSTSGTSMLDPNRETKANRKKVPVFTVQALLRVILELIKKHNFTALEGLGNLSPFQALQRRLSQGGMANQLSRSAELSLGLFEREETRPAKFEKPFRVYVNFAYVKYTSPALNLAHKGQSITIRYDIRDIRTVKAYTKEGEFIGALYAPDRWRRHPHSIRTRTRIFHEKRAHAISEDPVRRHFEELVAAERSSKAPRDIVRLLAEGYNNPEYIDRSKQDEEHPFSTHAVKWRVSI